MRALSGYREESARLRRTAAPHAHANGVRYRRLSRASWWLLGVVCVEAVALFLVPVVLHAACRLRRQQHRERVKAFDNAQLMDTVLSTSPERPWAVGADGRFTFPSPTNRELLGYEPSELLGRPCNLVIELDDMPTAWKAKPEPDEWQAAWTELVAICRHRDGTGIPVEGSGRPRLDRDGRDSGYEGTIRPLGHRTARSPWAEEVRARVEAVLAERTILTAFQPIRCLGTGAVIGAEALTRFGGSAARSSETWFAEAASIGRGPDLELLAMETALLAAAKLPDHLYIAVNLSPRACIDSRLGDILQQSFVSAGRIVVEVTEQSAVADYEPLAAALANLRHSGLRIAVDDAGAGFASMRHILQLKPELIKLDGTIIAGIDTDPGQARPWSASQPESAPP